MEKSVANYCDHTIFAIEPSSIGKIVHLYGYGYNTDDGTETPYRFVEYTFVIATLKSVIDSGFTKTEQELAPDATQYITECSADELIDIYEGYMKADDLKDSVKISCDGFIEPKPVSEITEDMDYGLYLFIG